MEKVLESLRQGWRYGMLITPHPCRLFLGTLHPHQSHRYQFYPATPTPATDLLRLILGQLAF